MKEYLYLTIFLKSLVEIACFICDCILCGLSSKNPLETHTIGNLTSYCNVEANTPNPITNNSKRNDSIIYQKRTKEHILNISKNNSSEEDIEKNKSLRQLVSYSFCSQICDDIGKNKGQKFSNIFDINYKKIFGISIANMVIS